MAAMSPQEDALRKTASDYWSCQPSPSEISQILTAGRKWWFSSRDGLSPLMLAAKSGKIRVLAPMLEQASRREVNARAGSGSKIGQSRVDSLTPLMLAAIGGSHECVELLLKSSADAAAVSASKGADTTLSGRTALMLAVAQPKHACARILASASPLAALDPDGRTAFMIAAKAGSALLLPLLAHPGCADAVDHSGMTALMLAVSGRCWEAVDAILSTPFGGALRDPSFQNRQGLSAAMIAASNGDSVALSSLVKALPPQAWLNRCSQDLTPLMRAAMNGREGAVAILAPLSDLAATSRPKPRFGDAFSAIISNAPLQPRRALEIAEAFGYVKIADQIKNSEAMQAYALRSSSEGRAGRAHPPAWQGIMDAAVIGSGSLMLAAFDQATESGQNLPQLLSMARSDGVTPLMAACAHPDGRAARYILGRMARPDWRGSLLGSVDSRGRSAALIAAESGSADALRLLLESGASLGPRDARGLSAAMLASAGGHLGALQAIKDLRGAAGFEGSALDGKNALMFAAIAGHSDCVALLASLRGEPALERDVLGMSALMHAACGGHARAAKLLLPISNQGSLNLRGETALFIAAKNGHAECCSVLASDEEANRRSRSGLTPLMAAALFGHAQAAQVLVAYGMPTFFAGAPVDAEHDFYDRCNAMEIAEEAGHHDVALIIESAAAHPPLPPRGTAEPLRLSALAMLSQSKREMLSSASSFSSGPEAPRRALRGPRPPPSR